MRRRRSAAGARLCGCACRGRRRRLDRRSGHGLVSHSFATHDRRRQTGGATDRSRACEKSNNRRDPLDHAAVPAHSPPPSTSPRSTSTRSSTPPTPRCWAAVASTGAIRRAAGPELRVRAPRARRLPDRRARLTRWLSAARAFRDPYGRSGVARRFRRRARSCWHRATGIRTHWLIGMVSHRSRCRRSAVASTATPSTMRSPSRCARRARLPEVQRRSRALCSRASDATRPHSLRGCAASAFVCGLTRTRAFACNPAYAP